jgi:benzoate/toluate 1,2-dioxygenase subunit alpha
MIPLAPIRKAPDVSELVIDEANTFRVHTRAYTDPAVFAQEMTRIFEATWIYVAHESELRNPGDYKTSYIGRQPVIVSRADDGELNVLVNRCVHRGTVVCRESRGNANGFTCAYHGWSYDKRGQLVGIPMQHDDSGYAAGADLPSSLFRVPRVESYRGLIFASFNADVEPLAEHLGVARRFIDRKLNQSPVGEIEIVSDPYVVRFDGNWKFQSENIVDTYHFLFVHNAFARLQEKYGDTTGDFGVHRGGSPAEMRKIRSQGVATGYPQGHGLAETPVADLGPYLDGSSSKYYRELVDRWGATELEWMLGNASSSLFPNVGLIHHQIRTWRPISPTATEVTVYPFDLKGAPREVNEGWLRSQERFYGPSGYGMADDIEIFNMSQQGMQGSAIDWLIFERALHTERIGAAGEYTSAPMGETPQRAFWRSWKRRMAGVDDPR